MNVSSINCLDVDTDTNICPIDHSSFCSLDWTKCICGDIDECSDPSLHPLCKENTICSNTKGNYTCICSDGYEGICFRVDHTYLITAFDW